MKFNLKTLALAAALVAAGSANAAFVPGTLPASGTGNSTLTLFAWDNVSGAYYLRDLGYTLNTFLPDSGASITPTGELGTVFDKTPEAGLDNSGLPSLNASDAGFGTWLAGTTSANVRWTVGAADRVGTVATNRFRQIGAVAVGASFVTPSNGTLDAQVLAMNGLIANGGAGTTFSGSASPAQLLTLNTNFTNQGVSGSQASVLGGQANLYYWTRSTNTGSAAFNVNQDLFDNSGGSAVLSLASNGDFSYALAPVSAVPLPAAAWLMGAGLMGLGGAIRRRKAAAQQV